MLPHEQAGLAPEDLFDLQTRRGWSRMVSAKFVAPFLENRETETRFVPARVSDNRWNNPVYVRVLRGLSGRQRRAVA